MMLIPKYAENIIVAVEYKRNCQWYITNKLIWILDYEKKYNILQDYYISIGRSMKRFNYEVGSIDDFSKSRFGILILDESKADLLLSNIENYKVSTVELRDMYSLEPVHIKIASKIIAKVRFPKYKTSSLS